MANRLLVTVLLATVLITSAIFANMIPVRGATNPPIKLTEADNEAKQIIIANASSAVDHKWDRFDLLVGSLKGDNSTFVIYNQSSNTPLPPVVCGPGTHEENGTCVPDLPPQCGPNQFFNNTSKQCEDIPVPPDDNTTQPPECQDGFHLEGNQCVPDQPPVVNNTGTTTIHAAGDFSPASNAQNLKGDINVALGDLTYATSLDAFTKVYPADDTHKCVIGNHDSNEEESGEKIVEQAKKYCKEIWFEEAAGNTTLLIGANTNGDLGSISQTVATYLQTPSLMDGIKNVILFTHKPCHINTDAHHTVEGPVKTFCSAIETNIPSGVNFVTVAGHEHNAQKNDNGLWYVAGTGGKGNYACGSNEGGWSFCNDSDKGYLSLEIDNNNGDITSKFIKFSGGVMN